MQLKKIMDCFINNLLKKRHNSRLYLATKLLLPKQITIRFTNIVILVPSNTTQKLTPLKIDNMLSIRLQQQLMTSKHQYGILRIVTTRDYCGRQTTGDYGNYYGRGTTRDYCGRRTTGDYQGLLGTRDYWGVLRTTNDFQGLLRSIRDYYGVLGITTDHQGLLVIIINYLGLLWTTLDYCGVLRISVDYYGL